MLLESDYRLSRATRNILLAEGKIADLQAELGDLEGEVSGRDQQLAELQAEIARLEDRTTDGGASFIIDEVTSILTAAPAVPRIVQRARSASERMQDDVRADATRLAAWRDHALPVIRMVSTSMDAIRAELDRVARRLVEALTLLEGLAIDDDGATQDQPADVVEVVDREGEPEALRVIEPRSERRG